MIYPQNLPTYKHDFEDALWQTKNTAHYLFYYTKDSAAERDIKHIAETQGQAFEKIKNFLELSQEQLPLKQIEYYLYPDEKTKKRLMGDGWYAQAIYNEMRIHVLYTDEIKPIGPHEDTHLLSLPFGLAVGFIQEGFAEYMVGHDWFGNSLREVAKEGLSKGYVSPTQEFLCVHEAWLNTNDEYSRYFYALAATLTEFLIKTYSKDKFLDLYKKLDRQKNKEENREVYVSVLGTDIGVLVENYFKFIA